MSSAFDVPKAVDKRLSTMAVDELAKRGMRTVKVLDKASIMSLIDEAVETVVADRLAELKVDDRERLREEAKTQFKKLVHERNSRQKEQQEAYEERIENLRAQAVSLEEKLEEAERQKDEISTQVEETPVVETVEVPASPSLGVDQIRDVVREAVAEVKAEPAEVASVHKWRISRRVLTLSPTKWCRELLPLQASMLSLLQKKP